MSEMIEGAPAEFVPPVSAEPPAEFVVPGAPTPEAPVLAPPVAPVAQFELPADPVAPVEAAPAPVVPPAPPARPYHPQAGDRVTATVAGLPAAARVFSAPTDGKVAVWLDVPQGMPPVHLVTLPVADVARA